MLLVVLLLATQAKAGTFSYSFNGWNSDPSGAKWKVQFVGTDNNDVAFAEGYIEKKESNGSWTFVTNCWNNYRGFANGDASSSSASGVLTGVGGGANVVHCRLVVKNHFGGEILVTGYFDILGNTQIPVDANGNPTDPQGNPLPPFAATLSGERTSGSAGVIHVTGIVMGYSADGGAHTSINVLLTGTQATNNVVSLPSPLPARDEQHGTWDLPIAINDANNPEVSFGVVLTPMVSSSADNAQKKTLSVSWPAYIQPPPSTDPATQPAAPNDQSQTRPAGNNTNDMAGNIMQGVGYGFGQGGLGENPYAPPDYPVPATTQPNTGTANNGISTTAPSLQPSNYRPQGPGPGTGSPLTGGGGIVGGKVLDSGPSTQRNASPSETDIHYGEYGTGGPWDRIRQKILAWLQIPPSMPTSEAYKITIPMPWFNGTHPFDIDFNSSYMSAFRVALRAFIAIFVIIAFLHQVIKDIRAY